MNYNPGINDRSGELLGRGIIEGGRAIGAGIHQRNNMQWQSQLLDRRNADQAKERAQVAKEEAGKRKKLKDGLLAQGEAMGLWTKDEGDTMSVEQLGGIMEGVVGKQILEKNKGALQEGAMRIEALQKHSQNSDAFNKELMAELASGKPVNTDIYAKLAIKHQVMPPAAIAQLLNRPVSELDLRKAKADSLTAEARILEATNKKKELGQPKPNIGQTIQVANGLGSMLYTGNGNWKHVDPSGNKKDLPPWVLAKDEKSFDTELRKITNREDAKEFIHLRKAMYPKLDVRDKMMMYMLGMEEGSPEAPQTPASPTGSPGLSFEGWEGWSKRIPRQ